MYINYATSSGQQTASAQITPLIGSLMGIDLTPPTTGYSVLTVYDSENSSISGKLILSELYCDAGTVGINHEYFVPVAVNRGIYCVLSGTGSGSHFYVRYAVG